MTSIWHDCSRAVLVGAVALTTVGCWTAPRAIVKRGLEPGVVVPGLSACTPGTHGPLELDPKRPLTVLVHGCNFSNGGFQNLSELFEAHDQQTVCFSYNDRGTIAAASSGHSEIVGEWGRPPLKLIAILQQNNILAQTPPDRRDRVAAVLRRLYGAPTEAAADPITLATLATAPGQR